jgi:uncharacterized lipoprotein YbaY
MKTKLVTLILTTSFVLALAGCASNNPEGKTAPPTATANPQVEKDAKAPGRGMAGPAETASE